MRQLTGDIFPGSAYGLNSPTSSGALDGVQGTLTSEGKTVFPYLKGPVGMDTGTYGYEATPLATQVAGASFKPLVTGPSGSALVGVYTHPNGVQEMVETFNQNQNQLQAELLRHGALNWVTRGRLLRRPAQLLRGERRRQLPLGRLLEHGRHTRPTTTRPMRSARPRPTSNTPPTGRRRTNSASTCCSTAAAASPTRQNTARPAADGIPERQELVRLDQPHLGSPEPRHRLRQPELHRSRAQPEQRLCHDLARVDREHEPDRGARQRQPLGDHHR